MHVHEKSGQTHKKKKEKMDECMSMKKKNIVDRQKKKTKRGKLHVHEQKWTDTKKKKKKIF